jgi:hypothetical protein
LSIGTDSLSKLMDMSISSSAESMDREQLVAVLGAAQMKLHKVERSRTNKE